MHDRVVARFRDKSQTTKRGWSRLKPLLGVLLSWFIIGLRLSNGQDSATQDQILNQYKVHLKTLEKAGQDSTLKGKHTLTMSMNGKQLINRQEDLMIARNGSNTLLRLSALHPHVIPKDRTERIREGEEINLCLPPDTYSIKSAQLGGPYYMPKSGPVDETELKTLAAYNGSFLGAPYSLLSHSIGTLLEDPQFRVTSVTPEKADGGDRWKIAFTSKIDSPSFLPGSGWFIVDPGRHWSLEAFEYRTTPKTAPASKEVAVSTSITRGSVKYGLTADLPSVERIEIVDNATMSDRKTYETKEVVEVAKMEWGNYPRDQFSLEYYSLDDLAGTAWKKRVWRAILLGIAAVAFFVISVLIQRRRFRKAAAELN